MSPSDTQSVGGTGASILAKEIAHELARLVKWTQPEERTPDPKGLRDVHPTLLNIDQAAKYMGRSVKGIRDLERKGILLPVRFDRKIQFRKSDLDEAIEKYRW
jgi:hypothetical protein